VVQRDKKQIQTGIKVKQFPKLSHCSIPQSPCCLSVVRYLRGIVLDPAHVEYIQLKIKQIQTSIRYYLN
jgi:hypothetical protein